MSQMSQMRQVSRLAPSDPKGVTGRAVCSALV